MKRILTIQDLSCIGKCSLTVALPIISSMQIETAVLPTAVLSTHTAFKSYTYRDLTNDLLNITEKWQNENFEFNSIYSGYLASAEQIDILKQIFIEFKTKDNFILVDPVMGDNGKLYKGFDENFAYQMKELCKTADIIVPNLTECIYMLKEEYKENYDEEYIKKLLVKLCDLGPKKAVLTGVSFNEKELGVMGYDKELNIFFSYFKEKIPVKYHGTGDVFASTFLGALTNENSFEDSLKIATDFVWETIQDTYIEKHEDAYGVNFEKYLYKLKGGN